MALSSIAAIVNDYAVTEAKRSGSERITGVHVLLAVSRFRAERFDSEFPGMAEGLRRRSSALKGTAPKPTGYDAGLDVALEGVRAEADLWELASTIAADLSSAGPESSEPGADGSTTVTDSPVPADARDQVEIDVDDEEIPDLDSGSFPLTAEFVRRVAGVLAAPVDVVADLMAKDALRVCRFVSSSPIDEIDQTIASSLGSSRPGQGDDGDEIEVVARLVDLRSAESSSVAREAALVYVAVATWAAAADTKVTDDEVARIDELRLRLRSDLDGALEDPETNVDVFDRLFDGLIGMESVKAELRNRIDHYVVARRRQARGMTTSPQSMHMAFLGNPGTGKTEVARRYAQVLREMGLLSSGQLIEVDRSGLVGQYVGQSEKRTSDVIDRARGGVLFIDEAYSVGADAGDARGYGQQIIDILVKSLEDHRDDLVVIFAGYEKPMGAFFATNEGLRSRVPTMIRFADYSASELTQIVGRMAEQDGYLLSDEAQKLLAEDAERLRSVEGFGNARTMRNLYEAAIRNQSSRLARLGDLATRAEMQQVLAEDIPRPDLSGEQGRSAFGFGRRGVSD